MATETCYDIFADVQRLSARFPSRHGAPKLREAQRGCQNIKSALTKIAHDEQKRFPHLGGESLGNCVGEECEQWLREVPVMIARLLGFKVLPGIFSLEGDDVPSAAVQQFANLAEQEAKQILERCEVLRQTLKSSVGHEYNAMRRACSALMPLVEDVLDLIDRALDLVPQTYPNRSLGGLVSQKGRSRSSSHSRSSGRALSLRNRLPV